MAPGCHGSSLSRQSARLPNTSPGVACERSPCMVIAGVWGDHSELYNIPVLYRPSPVSLVPNSSSLYPLLLHFDPCPLLHLLLLSLVGHLVFLFHLNSTLWWWHGQAAWLRQWATIFVSPACTKAIKKMKILPAQESFYVAMPIRQMHEATWGNVRLRAIYFHWWQPGRGRKKGVYPAVLNV